MIPYIVLGGVNGLDVALLALGLVLIFKAGRFVNFAHAQLGVVSSLLLAKFVLANPQPFGRRLLLGGVLGKLLAILSFAAFQIRAMLVEFARLVGDGGFHRGQLGLQVLLDQIELLPPLG